jgi:peptidoglycan/xylan/chitin deacetylase (PgdA/CDA1 family)
MPHSQRIALKIDVPTYRAAATGVPVLLDLLRRHRAGASFVFALGPDWLGRSPGRRCAATLQQVRETGCEVGVHGWNAKDWTKQAEQADAAWTEKQITQSIAAFGEIFAAPPELHAAPGWRSNPHGLRLTQRLKFRYASDTRGRHPFIPVWNGEIVRCPQIPTTLPTFDELAGSVKPDPHALREQLLSLTSQPAHAGHVFTLRAQPNATPHADFLEGLLTGWREQGYELTSIQSLTSGLDMDKLPRHEVVVGKVPGGCGAMLLQGEEFLSAWRYPT